MMILVVTPEHSGWQADALRTYKMPAEKVIWSSLPVASEPVESCIDLLFDNSKERINTLNNLGANVVFVSYVAGTTVDFPDNFVRINAWPGFFEREITECAAKNRNIREVAEKVLSCFNRKIEWTPDIPGFISARIISMIVNEAYFALKEGVSTKAEIDAAMTLGTSYPLGPFAWSEKIGLKNIQTLLTAMAASNYRYKPCDLLTKEASEQ
ncbi:MAG: hypothetical protein IPH18_09370 [Chitinophagaceae bacterium]|nr:hypothetical protein [Chitinophagaceae bacterium]MBK8953178.1 hypothetical protein [Chitinophagaceae bacterium]